MNEGLKVSVIVPVYNCEKYLEKCLKSLIFQTYDNLEIICINDGSTDNSLKILKKFQRKDSRIKLLNQKNKGVSSARNLAMDVATGDYISFIDADDWILLTLYETFVETINKANKMVDIFVFNAGSYFEGQNDVIPRVFFSTIDWINHTSELTIHTFGDCRNPFGRNLSAANKIYRKEFLQNNCIKFKQNIKYEDQIFYAQTMFCAKSILLNDTIFYKYRNYQGGSATAEMTEKVFDIFKVVDMVEFEIIKHKLYEEYKYAFFQYEYSMLFQHYYLCPHKLKEKYFVEMKKRICQSVNKNIDMKVAQILKNIQILDVVLNNNFNDFNKIYDRIYKK